MENEKFVFKKINFLNLLEFFVIGIFLLLVFVNPIFAQSPALKSSSDLSASDLSLSAANLKKQRLEWKADSNAIEYKIEVRTVGSAVNSASQGKVQTFTTENSFIEFSLPSGQYEWRVIGIDFLGREQIPSGSNGNWQKFEIRKLVQPEIKKVEKKIVVENSLSSASEQNTTKIPILSSGVESDASVCLENVENGKVVTGKIENEVAIFPKVDNGEWKVKITNKSGLESETEPITIVDRADEEKRLEKLEQERLAQIEAERLAAEIAASDSESASAEESTDETPEGASAVEEAKVEAAAAEPERDSTPEQDAESEDAEEPSIEAAKTKKRKPRDERPEKNFIGIYWTAGSGITTDINIIANGIDLLGCLVKLDFSSYTARSISLLSLFSSYEDVSFKQKIFSSSGKELSYPFLGFLADYGVLHSYDTKLEWLPWKFSGFETGFGLEFSPTLVSALLASSNDINLYYQMELYPITANFEFLIPIAKKRRWLGIKLGGGMLLTHAYQIFSYESDSSVYYGSDTSDLFSDLGIEDISDFSTKYGETYFINYMLQAGIFFRLVSYHGFVCDFDLDYVYWNISDFSMSNIVANFSIGFKI